MKSLSLVRLLTTPRTVAYQVSPSMGCSRQNTGVGCHFRLQEIFPTQGLIPGLPHCRQALYPLSHQGSKSHVQLWKRCSESSSELTSSLLWVQYPSQTIAELQTLGARHQFRETNLLSKKSYEVKSLSCVRLFATPETVAYQALSIGFSRQEYWSGLPFPSPGNLPHPGIEPRSPRL